MKDLVVFLADGFEEIETLNVVDILKRAQLQVDLVSIGKNKEVTGGHDIKLISDFTFDDINIDEYKALFIPGGPAHKLLKEDENVINTIKKYHSEGKIIAAICAGPEVLAKAGILEDNKFTCYPGVEERINLNPINSSVVKNKNVITSMGPATAIDLGLYLIEELKDIDTKNTVSEKILYDKLKDFIKLI